MMFGKRAQEQRDLVISYKKTFSSPEGKAVLFDLMNRFHVLNPHQGSEYSEGQRSTVLHVMNRVGVNIEQLDQMLKGDNE